MINDSRNLKLTLIIIIVLNTDVSAGASLSNVKIFILKNYTFEKRTTQFSFAHNNSISPTIFPSFSLLAASSHSFFTSYFIRTSCTPGNYVLNDSK